MVMVVDITYLGPASLASAIAIKEQIENGDLKGTIKFLGHLQRKSFWENMDG